MIPLSSPRRRVARDLSRAGAVLSAAMLVFSVAGGLGLSHQASAAAQNGGPLQVLAPPGAPTAGQPLNSGGSATNFALNPPVGAACTGDSATGGYRVQSYMVPASIDPATLTFDSTGPTPAGTGATFRQPLFSSGTPFVDATTAVSTGLLTGLPAFSFGLFGAGGPQIVPAGTYNLGFACTLGQPSATQLDKYWNVQLTFAVTPSDSPAGISWTVAVGVLATTTTAATSTTTTTKATTTTTTNAATTTTIRSGTSTTTTVQAGSSTTSAAPPTTFRVVSAAPTGTLAATGSSPIPVLAWAILFIVFGRMALLLGRPLRVLPPDSR